MATTSAMGKLCPLATKGGGTPHGITSAKR